MRRLFLILTCLALVGCSKPSDDKAQPESPKPIEWTFVYLAGDSTCARKSESDRPKYGWGEKFEQFLVKRSTVDNRAVGGRSTKTFISNGHWSDLVRVLKQGNVVLIQFGHNDASTNSSDDRGTTPQQYYEYLCRMINDVKAKNAVPVILTPICRHKFSNGVPVYTHQTYPEMAKKAAADLSVTLLDIEQLTYEWLERLGEEEAKLRYMMSVEGSNDTTHLTELGATEIAEIIANAMKNSNDSKLSALAK